MAPRSTCKGYLRLSLDSMKSPQQLAGEAFRDFLKKHRRPTTLPAPVRKGGS